ncbi:MAG: hypothetical protein ACYDCC_00465 [Actinomycetota bacterium]
MNRMKIALACAIALAGAPALATSPLPTHCVWFPSGRPENCKIRYAGDHLDAAGVASNGKAFSIDVYVQTHSGRRLVMQCSGTGTCASTTVLSDVVDGSWIECNEHGADSGAMTCASW